MKEFKKLKNILFYTNIVMIGITLIIFVINYYLKQNYFLSISFLIGGLIQSLLFYIAMNKISKLSEEQLKQSNSLQISNFNFNFIILIISSFGIGFITKNIINGLFLLIGVLVYRKIYFFLVNNKK